MNLLSELKLTELAKHSRHYSKMRFNIFISILTLLIIPSGLMTIEPQDRLSVINSSRRSKRNSQPIFDGFPITRLYVAIPEEVTPGTLVMDLSKHPSVSTFLSSQHSLVIGSNYRYRLLNAFDGHLFHIGSKNGQLTVATRLDRESQCMNTKAQFCCNARATIPNSVLNNEAWKSSSEIPKSQLCHLVVHISLQLESDMKSSTDVATNLGLRTALIYLYIRLDDINDHTPQFASHTSSLNIAEDTPIGSVLHYFKISDPDAGENALHTVDLSVVPLPLLGPDKQQTDSQLSSMESLREPFEVRLNRDGVSLRLKSPLDREIIPAYDVTLIAVDGNKEKPRSSQMSLRIHVSDINDNPPKWVHQKNFDGTGKILNTPFESKELTDIGSEVPKYTVLVPEDTQVGTLIFWFQARDLDVGENARLQYSIDTSAPGGLIGVDYFSIQTNTGEVRLRAPLDYELISTQPNGPEIEVPVIVHDNPRTGRQLSARAILIVKVTDVNDMHPTIVANPLNPLSTRRTPFGNTARDNLPTSVFVIWENQPAGQPVASIHVSDPDTGDGGHVTCTMINDYFRLTEESDKVSFISAYDSNNIGVSKTDQQVPKMLEAMSGTVTYQLVSVKRLDREEIPRHQVILTCRDHDRTRPLVFTQRLDIEVLDENDNPPVFSSPVFYMSCPENAPPGKIIGRLNATDADVGENAKLRYWVDESDMSWVSIQPTTGEVRINTVFDREIEPERSFFVYVADSDGPSAHTASAEVKVKVLDENDHTPHFVDLYFFSVPENSPPGTEVGRVQAEDEDMGDNGKVRYLLRHPSREFELDKDTGKITVRSIGTDPLGRTAHSILDREHQDSYELAVIAEDSGVAPKRASTVVHISLSDVNDHAPEFRYPTPHGPGSVLNVSCAQLGSQIIAHVHANDSDTGRNGDIEYSIVRKSQTAERLKRDLSSLDTELKPSDSKENASSGVANKSSDIVTQPPLQATSTTTETLQDIPSNNRHIKSAPISQSLLGVPTEDHFDIDSYSGQLFLIHPILDCSQPADVRLVIKATDGGQPPKSSTAVLTIHIHPAPASGSKAMFDIQHELLLGPDGKFDGTHSSDMNGRSAQYGVWLDEKLKQTKPRSPNSLSSLTNQRTSTNYHWSAIVGLIVAMVVLVILLCLMLIILRRRFVMDERKLPPKRDSIIATDMDKYQTVGMTIRPVGSVRDLYIKGSQANASLHEFVNSSQSQNSFSPRSLSRGEEFNCSSVNLGSLLADTQQPMLGTQLFRAIPNSSQALTLNSGEIAVLHHHEHIPVPTRMGGCPPEHLIYKSSNGEFYGYIDTQPRTKNLIAHRNNYQTLQPQQPAHMRALDLDDPFGPTTPNNTTNNNNNNNINNYGTTPGELYRCNPIGGSGMDAKSGTRNGQYTPLFGVGETSKQRLRLASQPNLLNEQNLSETDESSLRPLDVSRTSHEFPGTMERALSLSDLTPLKTELLPSGFECLNNNDYKDRKTDSDNKTSTFHPQKFNNHTTNNSSSNNSTKKSSMKSRLRPHKDLIPKIGSKFRPSDGESNNGNPNSYCTVSFV